jgi:hypothetical protein
VTSFVEECRREWRRLGVPDPIAEEMAADLTADLEEAEAEGAAPEDVLGSGVSDPKAFAASWAMERGVVPADARPKTDRRPLLVGVGALLVVLVAALIVGVLLLRNTESRPAANSGARPHVTALLVPDVLGLKVVQGARLAESAGLKVVVAINPRRTSPGMVFAQEPETGTKVPRGSTLVLYLSGCGSSSSPCRS